MNTRTTGLFALVAGIAFGCSRGAPRPEPASGSVGATIEAIETKPTAYLGKQVTVSGEIERIHGKRAFTLGGRDFLFDRELLVVTPRDFTNVADQPGGPGLNEDDLVQVTGEVRRLEVAEIERELDLDLTPDIEIEFKSRPVIVARGLQHTPRKHPPSSGVGGGPDLAIVDPVADVAILIDAPPTSLIGKNVAIDDVKVQGVVGEKGIWVGPSHRQQVFVAAPGKTDVKPGDTIDIKGRIEAPPTSGAAQSQFGVSDEVSRLIATEPNIIRADTVAKD